MRGKISDQDLTNYALNDGLESRERLYIESMLGLSEECRNDVYRQLEVAQMLEEGFEAQDEQVPAMLTLEQREHLLTMPVRFSGMAFVRKTATALALAACVALVLANPRLWRVETSGHRMAAMSSAVSGMVQAMTSSSESDYDAYAAWVNPPTVNMPEDDSVGEFIPVTGESVPVPMVETVCTPPSSEDLASVQ